jgi:predicted thioredoxin/glutaredoxin
MKRYVLRHVGNKLLLSDMEISATDNIAVPSDGAVFTETSWLLIAALIGKAGLPADEREAAVESRIKEIASGIGLTVERQAPHDKI